MTQSRLRLPSGVVGGIDGGQPMVGLAGVDTDPEAGWSVGHGRLLSVGQHLFRPGDTRRQLRKQRPMRTSQSAARRPGEPGGHSTGATGGKRL